VRPDSRYLLFIQDFSVAATLGSRGSYQAAKKDPGVSAPTDAGVKSCFWPPGLLVNSAS
jgi:hypothetical protein